MSQKGWKPARVRSGGGEDQEAGEGGAALDRHDVVVSGGLQGDGVSGLQLQDGGSGGYQKPLICVAHHQLSVAALDQLQAHLSDHHTQTRPPSGTFSLTKPPPGMLSVFGLTLLFTETW